MLKEIEINFSPQIEISKGSHCLIQNISEGYVGDNTNNRVV